MNFIEALLRCKTRFEMIVIASNLPKRKIILPRDETRLKSCSALFRLIWRYLAVL